VRRGRSGESVGTRSGWCFSAALHVVLEALRETGFSYELLVCIANLLLSGFRVDLKDFVC